MEVVFLILLKYANIWNCDSDNTINEIVETFIEFMDNIENNR